MIKNALIAILIGALLVRILPAEALTGAAALGMSLMMYMLLLLLEGLWDKHRKRIIAHIRWCGLSIRELRGRRKRRKQLRKCLERLCILQWAAIAKKNRDGGRGEQRNGRDKDREIAG